VLIVYDSDEAKTIALQHSPSLNSTAKFFDDDIDRSSHGAMAITHASDRRTGNGNRSTKTPTFFTQLYRHGQGTARAPLKNAQDYFITKRAGFPWATIPDFVVGRAGVDNWLLVTALARRAAVVDVSRTVTARHQVRSGYDPAAHFRQPGGDATVNYVLAGRSFDYSLGLTECAPLETALAPDSSSTTATASDCHGRRTVVLRRRPLSRYCQRAFVKQRRLSRA